MSLEGPERLRVAVCFEAAGPSPWTIHAGAGDSYEIVWLVDSARDNLGSLPRLLQRLGTVIDADGGDIDATAQRLAAERVDGITTHSEGKITLAAAVAELLGLRYFSVQSAQALTDKAVERAMLQANGVPVPRRWLFSLGACGPGIAEALLGEVVYPAVLKPRVANGSRNVVRVDTANALRAELSALQRVQGDEAQGDVELIVEAFLEDRDPDPDFASVFSLEAVVADRVVHHLMSTGRFTFAPPFREAGIFLPSAVGAEDLAEAMRMADRAIAALGIADGMVHIEFKITPGGPRIIETNGVMGGGAIAKGLEATTGVSLSRCALEVAAGRFKPPELPLRANGVSFSYIVQPPVGRRYVESVDGLDELSETDEIDEIFLNRPAGSITDSADGTAAYICSAAGWVVDHAVLRRTVAVINETIAIQMVALP